MSRRAWCAKIPARAGLLYAGTEFGMYISFDNGAHWQSFQMNLPVTPVTDIKLAHNDLVLSTQGRSFWILDNLTPLHQIKEKRPPRNRPRCLRRARRFAPAARGGGARRRACSIRSRARRSITISEELRRAMSRWKFWTAPARWSENSPAPPAARGGGSARRGRYRARGDDEEGGGGGGRGGRGAAVRLDKSAGMHRFTWDLRYPGPWQSATRPEGPNGPAAVPGKYAVRLTDGAWTSARSR